MQLPVPLAWRQLAEEVDKRLAQIPTELNEYGYDSFGMEPQYARNLMVASAFLYRHYFRVEAHGIENVPPRRVLLIANHAGNTIPFDGGLLGTAMLLEAEPPRMCRALAEFVLPRIPGDSERMHRVGAGGGTPENCIQLLEREEAIMVFPEGHRGFIKPYSKAYQLQRFGTGFVRLALQTGTPVVPVGIIGSEEQSPGLSDARWLGRLIGAPAFPITVTFPLFGVLGYLPLPVKYRIRFGEPIAFDGDPQEDDAAIQEKVDTVKDRIALLLEEGLAERSNWFT
jgi:1-acyl-sn-glycerol-3-phosphate acyltransferase